MFTTIAQAGVGDILAPAVPLGFAERAPAAPAPRLGEHTEQVLAEVLGLTTSAIGKLHDAGTIAGPKE
jgi:2-methylfumaryl-CoA isomerase